MTKEEKDLIVKLYREKELFPEEIQRLKPFKKYKLYEIQLVLRNIKKDQRYFKEINELFKQGFGPTEITKKLDVSRQHVYNCLKENKKGEKEND